jgi:hypothetical protein
MSLIARLVLGAVLALCIALPASAVQPRGSAGWTTAGWVNFTGTLYSGPGYRYDLTDHVDKGLRVRVDRCTQRWCQIHTAHVQGWLSIDNLSFGAGPWIPYLNYPRLPVRYGGDVCFFTGTNFSGEQWCYDGGHVSRDLVLAGLDNAFASVKISGGSVLACRDRNFRSFCLVINKSEPKLDRLLSRSISSIHVY